MLFRCAFTILFVAFSLAGSSQKTQPKKINIVDFKVEKNYNKISIDWTTDNATPTNYFEVEKSNDGKKFVTIAYILGADPSKANCDCYGYFDKINPGKKESYYRLKYVDSNGEVEFSETRILALNK